jgi:hypothetical protein
MILAQYVLNQPNAHNNRSSGVSLRSQSLRHRYFGILAMVQGGLHSTLAIFGVLRGLSGWIPHIARITTGREDCHGWAVEIG